MKSNIDCCRFESFIFLLLFPPHFTLLYHSLHSDTNIRSNPLTQMFVRVMIFLRTDIPKNIYSLMGSGGLKMDEGRKNKANGVIFVVLFFLLVVALFLAVTKNVTADNNYRIIKVKQGDTLWSIARQYQDKNTQLTEAGFVKWVERENGISRENIKADAKLKIPVLKSSDLSQNGK
ncbi:LysM peptidoglycan-binding domain-containing protein [Sporolactobacillus sp. THM7-7]|nr:LysM peptidoglycan-binding domain-containing protein [Sporolactobacillus sp. THM7-7]